MIRQIRHDWKMTHLIVTFLDKQALGHKNEAHSFFTMLQFRLINRYKKTFLDFPLSQKRRFKEVFFRSVVGLLGCFSP